MFRISKSSWRIYLKSNNQNKKNVIINYQIVFVWFCCSVMIQIIQFHSLIHWFCHVKHVWRGCFSFFFFFGNDDMSSLPLVLFHCSALNNIENRKKISKESILTVTQSNNWICVHSIVHKMESGNIIRKEVEKIINTHVFIQKLTLAKI